MAGSQKWTADMQGMAHKPQDKMLARRSALRLLLTFSLLIWGLFVANPVFGPLSSPAQAETTIASGTLPELFAARIESNSKKTRFTADLNFAIGYNVYVLTNPYRVIIDIPDAVFNLSPGSGTRGKGLISGFRFGQLDDNRSRIVINVKGPVLIQNSYAVRAKSTRPARLIVDLVATDSATFAQIHQGDQVANLVAKEQAKTARKANNGTNDDDGLIPQELPPISAKNPPGGSGGNHTGGQANDPIANLLNGKPPEGQKNTPVKKSRNKHSNKLVIVLDPGHGGIDSGTSGRKGLSEKSVVLAFSKKLKSKLTALGRYKVILTRRDDSFVPLRKRVKIAHENKADLFIAIHADAIKHPLVRGTTLYTLSETASDEEAAELAAKENRADIIGGVNLAGESKEITNILIDLAQRETKNHSVYFAKKAVSQLKRVTRMAKRPLRSAGFVVLKAPDVPSVLLELGYLSNRSDAKLLGNSKWQKKVAGALARSIDHYFRARIALQ